MQLKKFIQNPWLTRIALVSSIITAIIVMILYTQVDLLVNKDLYNYNLQFNEAWYTPYSVYTKLVYVCLAIPAALSAGALALTLRKKNGEIAPKISLQKITESSLITKQPAQPSFSAEEEKYIQMITEQQDSTSKARLQEEKPSLSQQTESSAQVVHSEKPKVKQQSGTNRCLNCNKSFTIPLVTLNFADGKTVAVETCPYCGEPVGSHEEEEKLDLEIHVEEPQEQEASKYVSKKTK